MANVSIVAPFWPAFLTIMYDDWKMLQISEVGRHLTASTSDLFEMSSCFSTSQSDAAV